MRNAKKAKERKMIKIEVQYFNECPHASEMMNRVKEALEKIQFDYEYVETIVDSNQKAESIKFRGSPTLLINGNDYEGLNEPIHSSLCCRNYINGLPHVEEIFEFIKNISGDEL